MKPNVYEYELELVVWVNLWDCSLALIDFQTFYWYGMV